MSLKALLQRLVRATSGTAALEATIVVPVAISLMVGGVEFGRLFLAYGTAEKSMRDAARYLARVPKANVCGWGLDNARCLARTGNLTCTGQPLIPNWTDPTTVTLNTDCANPNIIDLRGAVPYTAIMFGALGFSNVWTMDVKHQEPWIGQ